MKTRVAQPLGARARALAIAVPLVAFLVIVGLWLTGTRTHYAGSNTVAPRSSLPALGPGHRICIEGLTVPARANAVRLQLLAPPHKPAPVTMRLSQAGGRVQMSRGVAPWKAFGGTFPITPPGRDVNAKACITTSKPLLAESGQVYAGTGGAAFYDGKPMGQLAVAYLHLPPRSLIATLPTAAKRASLFRAGFVGSWTYLVIAIVIALAWAAGLRLVFRGRR